MLKIILSFALASFTLLPLLGYATCVCCNKSIRQIHHDYISNKYSPDQCVEDIYKKTSQYSADNHFISVTTELAYKKAHEISLKLKSRKQINLLEGIPFVVKDNIDVVNYPTTAGTSSLTKNIAKKNSPNFFPIPSSF